MKNFIIATVIFITVAIISMVIDATGMYELWSAMPNALYYAFGWLAAGIYVAIKDKKEN